MKHRLFPVVFFILLVLSGCLSAPPSGGGPAAEEGPVVRQFFAMDTLMSVSVYGPQGEAAVQEAWEVLTGLDRLLSRTSPDSEISALNAHAGDGSWVPLSPETAELLSFARQTAEDLPGAFDCTIAPVMDAWGFGGEDRHVPDAAALSECSMEFSGVLKTILRPRPMKNTLAAPKTVPANGIKIPQIISLFISSYLNSCNPHPVLSPGQRNASHPRPPAGV